jgi:hypothetical protein
MGLVVVKYTYIRAFVPLVQTSLAADGHRYPQIFFIRVHPRPSVVVFSRG